MDLKTAAITGAVAGAVASFVFGKKTRGLDFEKIAKYAAGGAGALAVGSYVMSSVGGKHLSAGEHRAGWDLFHDVLGSQDPFHDTHKEIGWQRRHDKQQGHEQRGHAMAQARRDRAQYR